MEKVGRVRLKTNRLKTKSQSLFEEAKQIMPGGVNPPVRAYSSVDDTPPFIKKAVGPFVIDEDDNQYIDYVGSWGPAIIGHAHPEVVEAVCAAAKNGLSFGAPTRNETILAEKIRELVPSMEKLRLVNSGTEACMSVIRVARAFTKRDLIIKFTGCYHGHADMLLVKAGSGALTLGLPDSPGVPSETTVHTLSAQYNNIDNVRQLFSKYKNSIAAIIVEPYAGNTGFIRPVDGFLSELREICTSEGSLLIFDEVMTGFRVGLEGAQGLTGVSPDLTTLGKVIGGGMPIGAYGGRREIMSLVAPEGPVYQAGTLSGNPVAVACGLKTLEILTRSGVFDSLKEKTKKLTQGFQQIASDNSIPFSSDCEGGMFGLFFHRGPVTSHEQSKEANIEHFKKFFSGMLDRGIYLAPSAFEAAFVSTAHTDDEIETTLAAAKEVFKTLN